MYILTKLMRVLVKYWRSCGIRVVTFLDDGIGMDKGKALAIHTSNVVQKSLRRAGFIDHPEKCMWTLSTKISWLGFHIDLCGCEITVPREKIESLEQQLMEANNKGYLQARVGQYTVDPR